VLDRHRQEPGLLELVRAVGEQAGGEDDEEDARDGEELTQVEAPRAHVEGHAERDGDDQPDDGSDARRRAARSSR
jgi:hypothetical protein